MYQKLINEDDDYSYGDFNSFELKNRYKDVRRTNEPTSESDGLSKIDYVFHTIKQSDTLQGIALRYGCSISQLRHHNHIMSDRELYALSVVKIPVRKHSILKEIDAPTEFVDNLIDISNDSPVAKTQVINIGISNYLDKNGSDYQAFLDNLSQDLGQIRKLNEEKFDSTPLLNESDAVSKVNSTQPSSFMNCDGSDYDIQWRYLIVLLVIITLLVPSYVLYNLEHHGHIQNPKPFSVKTNFESQSYNDSPHPATTLLKINDTETNLVSHSYNDSSHSTATFLKINDTENTVNFQTNALL